LILDRTRPSRIRELLLSSLLVDIPVSWSDEHRPPDLLIADRFDPALIAEFRQAASTADAPVIVLGDPRDVVVSGPLPYNIHFVKRDVDLVWVVAQRLKAGWQLLSKGLFKAATPGVYAQRPGRDETACGVLDEQREANGPGGGQPEAPPMNDPLIFVSYSRTNWSFQLQEFLRDLEAAVLGRLQKRPPGKLFFVDQEGIDGAERWQPTLTNALQNCRMMLMFYAPGYFASPVCGQEVSLLLQRQGQAASDGYLLPVHWLPLGARGAPASVKDIQYWWKDLPKDCETKGLEPLCRRKSGLGANDYQQALIAYADRIVEILEQKPALPALAPAPPLLTALPDAFAQTAPAAPVAAPAQRNGIFISYAHADKKFLDELLTHLKPILRGGQVRSTSDRDLQPGEQWFAQIQQAIATCRVAVLLVTPSFLASDFIHDHELGPLLKAAEAGGVQILWVHVKPSLFEHTPLKNYQAVLPPEKPLTKMRTRDAAWTDVVRVIERATMLP